jgi:hypothetical protein
MLCEVVVADVDLDALAAELEQMADATRRINKLAARRDTLPRRASQGSRDAGNRGALPASQPVRFVRPGGTNG